MAAFDVPEAIAVSRTAVCAGGLAAVTRLQAVGLYLGYLAYYWWVGVGREALKGGEGGLEGLRSRRVKMWWVDGTRAMAGEACWRSRNRVL